MKEYEVYSALKVPINSKIIVRLDGRAFHALANNLNLKKPYDKDFYKLMEGANILTIPTPITIIISFGCFNAM